MGHPRDRCLCSALTSPAALCMLLVSVPHTAPAQTAASATLSGVITDPSGALIPNATLLLHPDHGPDLTVRSLPSGRYTLPVPPGTFLLIVNAEGFATFVSDPLTVTPDKPLTLNIQLKLQAQIQQVEVSDDTSSATDPTHNGDALILKGSAVDQLPLDNNELQQQLNALAGSATPDLYVDGFSGGVLPPRDTIREIRINQNPYSAQNDTNPVNGQIQIFTKPGTGSLHGDVYARGNDSSFNALNPFVTQEPAYHFDAFYASVSGPINKKTSFFLNGGHENDSSDAIVNAQILDASLNQVGFTQAVATPDTSYNLFTRIDTAIGQKSTLIARYSTYQSHQVNGGIGQFALATQGYDNASTTQTLQLSNSQIVSKKIVNDTRFQYIRSRVHQAPVSSAPTIVVQGAFTGGGSNAGAYRDNQDRFELQNYVSHSAGKQFLTYGGRLRSTRDANHSLANYNGEYIFASLTAYQLTQQGLAAGQTSTQIAAAGGGPSQFNLTTGLPDVAVSVVDTALFLQDDWKAKPNLSLSFGLRFETQDAIHDHADWAPRLGIAWGLRPNKNKQPQYTLRGGAGIFYRRFASGNLLQAARQNGLTQQEFIVNTPAFYPALPPASALGTQLTSTIFQINPDFHAPYFTTGTLNVERQVGSHGSVTSGVYFNRGSHTQLTRNINAPLPGTFNPALPTSGVRPFGGAQNIYEYESQGLYRDTRLTTNFYLHFKNRLNLFGFYQYRRAFTDDNGGGFPSNQYDLHADYGPVPNSPRHQLNLGGGGQLPFGFNAFGFIRASSGSPFNIVLGQDFNGDSQFNDRPSFATDLTRPSVVATRYGTFDTSPIAGQTTIPFDLAQGPGLFTVSLNFGREFTFGPALKPPAGAVAPKLAPGAKPHTDRKYTLNLSADAQNLFNHVNLATPVGTLGSPLFGRSTALAAGFSNTANRIITLQSYFRF